MKINIVKLNCEDENETSLSLRAWEYSRSPGNTTAEEIFELNLPVNEMPSAILEIESTILEREIIVSMRDHNVWARTSRVDDPLKFDIPVIINLGKYKDLKEESISLMTDAKNIGMRQDEYRMLLPLIALTKYTISINLRSLILLRNFFKDLYDTGIYRSNLPPVILLGAYKNLSNVIVKMTGSANLDKYPNINLLPVLKEKTSGRHGGFITYSGTINFGLRSHLIRHRSVFMNDNLLEIINSESFDKLTLESKVEINVTSSVEFWTRIVSNRSCWLAHYGMWKGLLDEVSKHIDSDIDKILPCSCGACPFGADNELRLENKDPNPPCPIYISNNNIVTNKKVIDEMVNQMLEDERPVFWAAEINKARKIWSGE